MAQSLEVGYPSFRGDAYRRLPHAPDTSVSDRTPKVKQRSKLTTATNILTSFSIALGSYGCAVGPAGFVEAANLPPNPIVTLTGMPDSATGIAETPTPQEGVQEPTFVDVPFLLPTDIVPSLTPLTPESSLTPTLTQTATEVQPSATATSTATPEASPTPDGLWCNNGDYRTYIHNLVVQTLEKNPDKVPILDDWPNIITNFENKECIGTVSEGTKLIQALKNLGFTDEEIEACREVSIEPYTKEKWGSQLWWIKKNHDLALQYDPGNEGIGKNICYWLDRPTSDKRREKLLQLYPKLK